MSTPTKPVAEVLSAIVENVYTDNQIEQILNAIDFRKQYAARQIGKGDVVKISYQNVRPRYLLGVECIVISKGPVNLSIKPKNPIGAKWDCGFRIKPEWVQKVTTTSTPGGV